MKEISEKRSLLIIALFRKLNKLTDIEKQPKQLKRLEWTSQEYLKFTYKIQVIIEKALVSLLFIDHCHLLLKMYHFFYS